MAEVNELPSFTQEKEDGESTKSSKNKTDFTGIVPMDSFERIEAQIMQEAAEKESCTVVGFDEDYNSMEEEATSFDEQVAAARGLRKQSKLDELTALDLQWKLERQEELAEKALERLEVAALIKKAEERLLPGEDCSQHSNGSNFPGATALETEELSPEMVMLDKIISCADLLRMESSDLSEEEGFRLRLSCIMEESESDASGSGVIRNITDKPKLHNEKGTVKLDAEPETQPVNKIDIIQQIDENNAMELAEQRNVKQEAFEQRPPDILTHGYALDASQQLADEGKHTSVQIKEINDAENISNQTKQPDGSQEHGRLTEENLLNLIEGDDDRDPLDSVGSSSPEPNFTIQKLKSGTKVDTLASRPVVKKRLESSSDSSFDLSTSTTSQSVEDAAKSIETVKAAEEVNPEYTQSCNVDISNREIKGSELKGAPEINKNGITEESLEGVKKAILEPNKKYLATEETFAKVDDKEILQLDVENWSDNSVQTQKEIDDIAEESLKGEKKVKLELNKEDPAGEETSATLSKEISQLISEKWLDDSVQTQKEIVEDKPEIHEINATQLEIEMSAEGSNKDLSIHTCESATPENMKVEMETSTEGLPENSDYYIKEVPDEEIQAMFPKVERKARGRSEEKEPRKRSDSQSVKSFDVMGAAAKVRSFFPRAKKNRGKSLESGMAEKQRQEEEKAKKEENRQRIQKGNSEPPPPPPVPPETYLWEELRRLRVKGGYPWTYLDKVPFDERPWRNQIDHEYEPINPQPQSNTTTNDNAATSNDNKDVDFSDAHFLRIPRDEELVISPEDMEVEAIGAARRFQDDLEERFLATPMTATTASRTDCDVNTSMLDSSGLEDLPLKRDSRSKKALQTKTEQMRAHAQGLQQRIRSQAGKLRNKLKSLPRPSFPKRDRSQGDSEEKTPRFKLPERPKFTMPDRPKFKMPQKPKIALQNLTKPLRDRQAASRSSGEPKKNLFDLDFRTYPRMFNKKSREQGAYATSSPKMARSATPPPAPIQPTRKKGPVGQRWVNRFDDIKYVDDRGSQISQASGRSDQSESLSGFHDRDFAIVEDIENARLPPPRAVSTKSSISRASEPEIASSRSSIDRPSRGVIEEIDSDQFFLRQKGISEDDINMEKYLSEEIKEAFRSPVVNALRQLDSDYEDPHKEVVQIVKKEDVPEEPLPPTRMRSLRRAQRVPSKEEPEKTHSVEREVTKERYDNIADNVENSKERYENIAEKVENSKERYENIAEKVENSKERYENIAENLENAKARYANIEDDNVSEYYKSPPEPQEYQYYKTPRPTPVKRKSSSVENAANKKKQNGWVEVEIETELEEVTPEEAPQPLQRRKSKRGVSQPIANELADTVDGHEIEPDYIIPEDIPPTPPVRTRSMSRGARSIHSLAKDRDAKETPVATRRPSSKSIHTVGIRDEPYKGESDTRSLHKEEHDTRSLHSLAFEEERPVALKRVKSLSRTSHSIQSLPSRELAVSQSPAKPQRIRSLSRISQGSRSYYSLADDEKSWAPQAPERTRSLSRKSVGRKSKQEVNNYANNVMNDYADYAVVDKKKPARPPPPRRKKDSGSPVFNTLPRRSPPGGPLRPVRNYATLGPSRPPRKTRAPPSARSLEHIYSADQISQSYAQIEDSPALMQSDDVHGSNKDLQATDVVEKMKIRPLPAPPRPPRFKTKSEEQSNSLEIVEEVCVSTQTDPLPDDLCLEDDIIQEFSHEQLRIQEEFLKEMREDEERIQREIEAKRARHIDVTSEREENEAKMEIIRQMDDIIREERRLLEDDRRPLDRPSPTADEKKTAQLRVLEDDMGYASLERRPTRVEEEPQPSTSFQQPSQQTLNRVQSPETAAQSFQISETSAQNTSVATPPAHPSTSSEATQVPLPIQSSQAPVYIPLVPEIINTERLRVGQLEVNQLTVGQLLATNLEVQELTTQRLNANDIHSTSLNLQEINSRSGNLTIQNLELPPELIQQIIARIPWEELRGPAAPSVLTPATPTPARVTEEEPFLSSHSSQTGTGRRRRRHHRQLSSRTQDSSEEEYQNQQLQRRQTRLTAEPQDDATIGELGQRLARACTSATVRAMRQFAEQVQPPPAGEERTRYVQFVLLVALAAIAGYFLLGWGANDVHHHHWDFQFPPQPPKQ